MRQYIVTGMSCTACVARVEKAVSKVPGVKSCSVSLLTNSMGVEGDAAPEDVIAAVVKAGYSAAEKGAPSKKANPEDDILKDRETPVLKRRLCLSIGFLIVLMYVSMGHMMWGFPMPEFFCGNPIAIALLEMMLATIVMIINSKFFTSGFRAIFNLAPNMDTLVALGSAASYVYSTVILFAMTGDPANAHHYAHELYFESAAMILVLITVGKMLEARSKGRTTNALKSLIRLAPHIATVVRNGQEVSIQADDVQIGDIFIVKPGESIPVDGVVESGESAINESALTGESIPVDKYPGDTVSAATINQSGHLRCRATRIGKDTTLSQIIKMVSDAAATKAPIAKAADTISGYFVPAVMAVAVVTTFVWLLAGQDVGFALARGISVLVVSCPCALGLATPVAIMVGSGIGAKNGILFKNAEALETTGKTLIVALDKTGTITAGTPIVTDIETADGITERQLIQFASSLERLSEHPLARAIAQKAEEDGIMPLEVTDFAALPGSGLCATLDGKKLVGGSMRYITSKLRLGYLERHAAALSADGKTVIAFLYGDRPLGIIAVADTIKPDSAQAISELKHMGIRTTMLTGDSHGAAQAIGKQAGVSEVISDLRPDDKQNAIRALKRDGDTMMVGDGINDAPALTLADTGVAIGAGTDVAIDAANVVLIKNSLLDVPAAIRLSRSTLRNIHENLFWAFFYNAALIPLAAGAWYPLLGWKMSPMLGAAAMSLSSFCVVSNALRLNLLDPYDPSHDYKIRAKKQATKSKQKEKNKMKKTLVIEGMMCGHCSARVKKALEVVAGVTSAEVSHEKGTAVVELSSDVANDTLKAAVEAQDYKVIDIK